MAHPGSLRTDGGRLLKVAARRPAHWLVPVLYAVCGLAFIWDLYHANTLAYGIIYAPLVATAVFHNGRSGLWVLSAVASVMAVVGAFFPVISPDLLDLIGNRFLSILAILATAAFVQHARNHQDRLVAETRRAEAAERMKTQVLTNLSQEIRTPLHALLGVLTLSMTDSKPEQRRALGQISSDGRQLLATIDNLIDLTRIEDHELQRQAVDLTSIARKAAESAGATGRARQVTVVMIGETETNAVGDTWATRRIMDNLLANAVRLSPAGGTVSVAVSRGEGTVIASVSDMGRGLPHNMIDDFQADAGAPEPPSTSSALGSTWRIMLAKRRYSRAYVGASKFPPQPQFSLPTPHSLTLNGLLAPLTRRSCTNDVLMSALQYSTQSHNSCGVPDPTFPAKYGSAPIIRHNSINSWVPRLLSSSTCSQR